MNFIVFKLVDSAKHSTIQAKPVRLNLSMCQFNGLVLRHPPLGLQRMMC